MRNINNMNIGIINILNIRIIYIIHRLMNNVSLQRWTKLSQAKLVFWWTTSSKAILVNSDYLRSEIEIRSIQSYDAKFELRKAWFDVVNHRLILSIIFDFCILLIKINSMSEMPKNQLVPMIYFVRILKPAMLFFRQLFHTAQVCHTNWY